MNLRILKLTTIAALGLMALSVSSVNAVQYQCSGYNPATREASNWIAASCYSQNGLVITSAEVIENQDPNVLLEVSAWNIYNPDGSLHYARPTPGPVTWKNYPNWLTYNMKCAPDDNECDN